MKLLNGRTILIVEDEQMNRQIARSVLEMAGAAVVEAVDGQEAVRLVLSDQSQTIDLILMDISMPKMNGYDASLAIRQSTYPRAKEIKIYAITADIMCYEEGKWREARMNGVLEKPLDYRDVVKILE
ncbi:MAG TPA: response regulator [Lachnospiraceae bacterium]|nr:response regulator [Lachnospiraceae bacterium]HPF28883.1 response regulator [Lachnospiraceae bacterium]